jgi:hypothetical protein
MLFFARRGAAELSERKTDAAADAEKHATALKTATTEVMAFARRRRSLRRLKNNAAR